MLRSLAAIAVAINLSAPGLPDALVDTYAVVVRDESLEHELDPLLVVAVVRNESRWFASAQNHRTDCVGLGGICLRGFPVCQDPDRRDECVLLKGHLLEPVWNLRVTAAMLESNRDFCEARVGHASTADWLSSYQGFNDRPGRRGVWCNHVRIRGRWVRVAVPRLTQRVIAYRDALARRLR
jgi:hypothetical protein